MTGYLGNDEYGNRVEISADHRRQQTYIIGSTGTGKSTLIENLIIQDIIDNSGVALFDPKGDLVDRVIERIPQKRLGDVILLDVANIDYVFGLNLYECHSDNMRDVQTRVEQVMHIMELLYDIQRTNPLIAQTLRNASYTLIANGLSFTELPHLLTNPPYRRKLLEKVTIPQVRGYWQQFEQKNKLDRDREIEATRNKFDEMLQPMTFAIVGQLQSTITMSNIMDVWPGKILLVKLDARMPYMTSLVGSLLVAKILNATYDRQEMLMKHRKTFNVYVDEFSYVANPDFENLFDQARGFGVTLTVAHQTRAQLSIDNPKLARSVLGAGTKIIFRVPADAEELASFFDATPPEPEMEIEEEPWGDEEVKTPVKDVLGHLLDRGSHPDAVVNTFVQGTLQELEGCIQQEEKDSSHWRDAMYGLNSLLYAGMTQNSLLPHAKRISDLLWCIDCINYRFALQDSNNGSLARDLAAFLETGDEYTLGTIETATREMIRQNKLMQLKGEFTHIQRLRSEAKFYKDTYEGSNSFTSGGVVLRPYIPLDTDTAYRVGEWQQNDFDWTKAYRKINPQETWYNIAVYEGCEQEPLEQWYQEYALEQAVDDVFTYEEARFLDFIRELKEVIDALAEHPLDAGSGIYRPVIRQIKRKPPQRTYSDMQGEIANNLAGLPNMTTMVKTPTDEHEITIERSGQGIPRRELQQRLMTIQENNLRDGYLRIRSDVEKEINARIQHPQEPPVEVKKVSNLQKDTSIADNNGNTPVPPKKRPKVV